MSKLLIEKIGVSGDRGSFSEEAALLYARTAGIEPKLSYLIDMERVLTALEEERIDLGIFPVVNSRGGLVQNAFEAMGRHLFTMVDEVWLDVRQNLLVKKGVKKTQIKTIVSHPQALSQCERHLQKKYATVKLRDYADTAKAARDLSDGKLNKHTAVIAPALCAKLYDLDIIESNIQDNHPNLTTFIVVKK